MPIVSPFLDGLPRIFSFSRDILPQGVIARAGEWDSTNKDEFTPQQDQTVGKIYVHEKFQGNSFDYNIALMILERSVTLNQAINVVCLPENPAQKFVGQRCAATGWGKENWREYIG